MTRVAAISLLVAALVRPSPAAAQLAGDERIAALYREAARGALETGDDSTAVEAFRRVLDYDPDDYESLLALVRLELELPVLPTRLPFRIDRLSGSPDPDIADEAHFLRARYLYRVRRFDELVVRLGPADAYLEPRSAALRIRALVADGNDQAARAAAQAALGRFPANEAIVDAALEALGAFLQAEDHIHAAGNSAELYLRLASVAPDASSRRQFARQYLNGGGRDALAVVLLVEAAAVGEGTAAASDVEAFSSLDGSDNLALQRRLIAALRSMGSDSPESELESLVLGLQPQEGPAGWDADLDGYSEAVYTYAGAMLREIALDPDQDGRPAVVVGMTADGLPGEVRFEDSGRYFEYRTYPEVSRVGFRDADATGRDRAYHMAPNRLAAPTLAWDFQEPVPYLAFGGLASALPVYPLEDLARLAYRLTERSSEGATRVADLSAGLPLRAVEDLDGDGMTDRIVRYSDGGARTVLRDIDGDGAFETTELHGTGGAVTIFVDTDGDGAPDVREVHAGGYLGEWDLNGDGLVDIAEARRANQETLVEFSGEFDGFLDLYRFRRRE